MTHMINTTKNVILAVTMTTLFFSLILNWYFITSVSIVAVGYTQEQRDMMDALAEAVEAK